MERRQSKISTLAGLLTCALFALCLLAVLLAGAGSYRNVADRGGTGFQYRTAAGYLSTRIRQGDMAGCIAVERFGDTDALVLREQIGGKCYATHIYCRDGYLWELFALEGGAFAPEDGEQVLELEALCLHAEGQQLTAEWILPDGTEETQLFCLRSQREVSP